MASIAITGGSFDGTLKILTLNTSGTLAAGNSVTFGYSGAGALKDAANNSFGPAMVVIGSNNGTTGETINLGGLGNGVLLRTNGGPDNVVGSNFNDTLVVGGGADTVDGGGGADNIHVTETTRAVDTVQLLTSSGQSMLPGYDHVYGFDVSNAATNDVLNLPSGTIAADMGLTTGTAVGLIAKHSISGGIVSFADAAGNALAITNANKADALNYLSTNLTAPGRTVGAALDADGNGQADSLLVFQDGVPLGHDGIAQLNGVNGVTLGTVAGQNVVQIVDTTAPATAGGQTFSPLAATRSTYVYHRRRGRSGRHCRHAATECHHRRQYQHGANITSNVRTLTTSATLQATDWVFSTSSSTVADAAGNVQTAGQFGVVGGSGASSIDVSAATAGVRDRRQCGRRQHYRIGL
ncbi:MAG: hypothetical protein IPL73_25290 [Candidatus Obscuribacter sp.]|nr:hypothetical protein [Candidatus Obscuribacter sp.]